MNGGLFSTALDHVPCLSSARSTAYSIVITRPSAKAPAKASSSETSRDSHAQIVPRLLHL